MSKRSSKPPRTDKRRRGSVLVIVVAVLTLIALIGTAYIATARLDRYSAQEAVATAKKESTNQQYLDEVERMVRDAIASDFDNPLTGFRSVPWLASRIPQFMAGTANVPVWRYITRKLQPGMDAQLFDPPLQLLSGYPSVEWCLTRGDSNDGMPYLAANPTSLTLTYPNNYVVEKYRNKVRTFPALSFVHPGQKNLTTDVFPPGKKPAFITVGKDTCVYLAADADGDGIADSVLFRVSTGPIQGVTYYAAVRVIDNTSAININTARTIGDARYNNSDVAFDPTGAGGTGIGLRTFFPSSIGLRELFHVAPGIPGYMPNPGKALWAIDEYRLGHDLNATLNNSGDWDQKVPIPLVITDENQGGTPVLKLVNEGPTGLNYSFATLGEALSMQLARRMESPGYREKNIRSRFRLFDETTAAALAYRFCMDRIDPESSSILTTLTPFEDRMYNAVQNPQNPVLVDAVVRSAPNYANTPDNTFKTFPANAIDDWFSWLNYDANPGAPMTALDNAVFIQANTNAQRFRSVRPLLTAYNPVTNLIATKTNPFKWPGVALAKVGDVLYPGMTITNPNPLRYGPAGARPGDIIEETNASNRTMNFMYMGRPAFPAVGTPAIPASSTGDPRFTDEPMDPRSWERQPYVTGHAKTSINTAGFPELWRAFFLTMNGPLNPSNSDDLKRSDLTPFDINGLTFSNDPFRGMQFSGVLDQNDLRMFRSSLRYKSGSLPPAGILDRYQMMVLRSALAAINTISLRDRPITGSGSTIVPTRAITLYHFSRPLPADPPRLNTSIQPYQVSVFGMVPQPFITEVYANDDANTYGSYQNRYGYVAIELYNPYNVAIKLEGWRLAVLKRNNNGTLIPAGPNAEHVFLSSDEVPAGGYLILESYDSTNGNAYRPPSSQLSRTGALTGAVSVKELALDSTVKALGNEVVLLRPRDTAHLPTGTSAFADMIPVDQFDFFGLSPTSSGRNHTWHYVRSTSNWEFIYPGRYDGSHSGMHHQGIRTVSYYGSRFNENDTQAVNAENEAIDPWNPNSGVARPFQEGNGGPTPSINLGNANTTATYPYTCVIPWQTVLKGPPAITGGSTYQYPFGGFARNADILQVPFIGAYVIKDSTGNVIEMNSVPMDSAFAEDTNPNNNKSESSADIVNDGAEQVGRFCPIPILNPTAAFDALSYAWAGRLFDYLDVQVPADDYLPNMKSTPNAAPTPVANHGQWTVNANRGFDDAIPSHGKINILTAPPKVLAMLPMVPYADGLNCAFTTSATDPGNENVARAIASFRDDYWEGPPGAPTFPEAFQSILDLNRVQRVRAAANVRAPLVQTIKSKQGNYYDDGANSGFDERFLITNRVSNLITTRSDTFTVYIVVQGWREADTKLPCLEWEQRKAFIIDRSAGPDKLKIIPVPTD